MKKIGIIGIVSILLSGCGTEYVRDTDGALYAKEKYCEQVPNPAWRPVTAGETLVGAGIGGFVGSKFGDGDGKDAMTVVGALIGASLVEEPRYVWSNCRYKYTPVAER